jgi:CheY-like chemotaxis protein
MAQRILVIENQRDNRTTLRDMLSSVGYTVLEAIDGPMGVAMAKTERPDLILMYTDMLVMAGSGVSQRIKAEPSLTAIPLIAVSSHLLAGGEKQVREVDCDAYMMKPVNPRALLRLMRRLLDNK